ncbi:MAG TPA: hypothetical protein VLK85_20565 [Ramlibacter sp.]|nr:hypothetical protein [Ramlibacter sp.]
MPRRYRVSAALIVALTAAHAGAQTVPSNRAVIEPVSGVQVSYERLGPDTSANPPGRFDGSVVTPAGTLRTTVRAVPAGDRHFQRGDTTFELPTPVFGGQLQVRELESGGTAAAWRARLDAGLTAETQCEWTSVRSGQALKLQQHFGEGNVAQARLSSSRTTTGQGSRWDFEVTQGTGFSRWSAGIAAAERSYVSASGGREARVGVRLGTQWLLFPHARMEARYTRQVRWDAEEPVSSVMLGTRFDLPWRLSLVTGLETDADDRHKASLTLSVPLEPR